MQRALLPTRNDRRKASRGEANTTHAKSLSFPVAQEPGHRDLNTKSFSSSTARAVKVAGCVRADPHLWWKLLAMPGIFHQSSFWSRTSVPLLTI